MPMHVSVNLPQHAFDYLQMPAQAACQAKELLSGKTEIISFSPERTVNLDLPALGGKILKITFKSLTCTSCHKKYQHVFERKHADIL